MENKTTIKLELYIINLQGLKYKTRLEKLLFSQPHVRRTEGGLALKISGLNFWFNLYKFKPHNRFKILSLKTKDQKTQTLI
jgi:hypothetical protein